MPASQRIITKLRERRQIEADLRNMLSAPSASEFQHQAQRIASLRSDVLPAIMGNLDRADDQMLVAIGTVATYLDRSGIVPALREAMHQPERTDRGRWAAMTILQRFLGEVVDEDVAASTAAAPAAAVSSLPEVLSQAERDPAALIDFVQALDRQEPDVVLAVIRAVRDGEGQQRLELLRMMAQDVREEIAAEAIQTLGTVRHPDAARALQTLIPVVARTLRPATERLVRKLQFTGVEVTSLPAPDPTWRALVGPVDGGGEQNVWFIQENRWSAQARLLRVLLSDRFGAIQAAGHSHVSLLALPPRRAEGYLHDIALPDGSAALLMLEASFDLGRRLVVDALAHNRETQIPVAGTLRHLSTWLWGYGSCAPLPQRRLLELTAEDLALLGSSDRLLHHPAFGTWLGQGESVLQAAEAVLHHPGWDLEVWARRLAGELFGEAEAVELVSQRLVAMGEWLFLAGDEFRSREALAVAETVRQIRPQDHPFLLALVRRSLDLVLDSQNQDSDLAFDKEN